MRDNWRCGFSGWFLDFSDLFFLSVLEEERVKRKGRTCTVLVLLTKYFGGCVVIRRSPSIGTFGPIPMNLLKNPCFAGLPIGTAGLGAGILNDPFLVLSLYPAPVVGVIPFSSNDPLFSPL